MTRNGWSIFITRMAAIYLAHGANYAKGWESESQQRSYQQALLHITDEILMQALSIAASASSEGWPPSEGMILKAALEIASPVPDVDSAWCNAFERCGHVEPEPPIHRLVDDAADALGGIRGEGLTCLWHEYRFAGTSVGLLRRQYAEAYERMRGLWYDSVDIDLRKAPDCRNPNLFPRLPGKRFALPWDVRADREPFVLPAAVRASIAAKETTPLPLELRRRLNERGILLDRIVKKLP